MQPKKRVFEWEKTSSVPEDLDTIEDGESEKSPTIHSDCCRKLGLLSTGSDDSGIGIEDADFEVRETDHDLEDETDSCEERVSGRHILHSQELFWRCWNENCDGKRTDFPSSDKNGRLYTINRQSVLAGRLSGNGHIMRFKSLVQLWIYLLQ